MKDAINNEKSLSDLVFNGGTCKTYTLEQSWDAVRIILDNFTTDAMGGENVLEGVDLGECCMLIENEDLDVLIKDLNGKTIKDFEKVIDSDDFRSEEFYWDELWKDEENREELIDFCLGIYAFFKEAKENNQDVLFYLT